LGQEKFVSRAVAGAGSFVANATGRNCEGAEPALSCDWQFVTHLIR
jgi:hypothetical protein